MKAATAQVRWDDAQQQLISIHAAREGGDCAAASRVAKSTEFQSTPPVKAATIATQRGKGAVYISIHAAREGGDVVLTSARISPRNFNPRRP